MITISISPEDAKAALDANAFAGAGALAGALTDPVAIVELFIITKIKPQLAQAGLAATVSSSGDASAPASTALLRTGVALLVGAVAGGGVVALVGGK